MVEQLAEQDVIKSVSFSQDELLRNIMTLYCPQGFDVDPTYSVGGFYKNIIQPRWKLDLNPQCPGVMEADCRNLPFSDGEVASVIFDPPFMFGAHGQTKNYTMTKRFTMFDTYEQLVGMYTGALLEFFRILKRGGYLFFKCQDYTDSKTTMTHCLVYNWAKDVGFCPEDLFILINTSGRLSNPNLTQRHARKFHCYWWVFKRK